MRSESRLGDHEEDAEDRSFSRASMPRGTDTTDTSGTEGSGPVIENRRRKKSSASSSNKRAAARAANSRETKTSPPKRVSPRKEQILTNKSSFSHSGRTPFESLTSPLRTLRTESAMEYSSPDRSFSARRAPLPTSFQSSRYRSDVLLDADYEIRRASGGLVAQGEMWPRGEELPIISPADMREGRRRRHVSDAIPSTSEVSNRPGRVVVDTSGVAKHLSRSSKYGAVAEGRHQPSEWSDRSSNVSANELARDRKISTSSSISQRSSGAASELHRTISRASLRRSHGRDVFDDGGGGAVPPLPNQSGNPLSPRFLVADQQQQQALAMAQVLKQKQERLQEGRLTRGEDWRKEVEELQARIDHLSKAANKRDLHSRSSSRASASRSSQSQISSTPSASISRRANRPSTEPRLTRNEHDRASSEVSRVYSRYETASRAGLQESERRIPVTPNMTESRVGGSSSRLSGIHTGPIPSTGRFSSLGQGEKRSLSASMGSGQLHERNLFNSVGIFERYLLGRPDMDISKADSRSPIEATDLVNRFKEASEAAVNINIGLRSILQNLLELQIDAEVGESPVGDVRLFSDLDKDLSLILRDSDDQIRSLADGLITFTKSEKERDKLRRKVNEMNNTATMPRPTSRLSSLGLSQVSPDRERMLGRASRLGGNRASSFDLRRSLSIRDKMTMSNSNTSIQAVESRSDNSSGSRQSSDSGQQSRLGRRFSMLHENQGHIPPSPYSPSPNPTNINQTRVSNASPSLETQPSRDIEAESQLHSTSHARSISESSPKTRSAINMESLLLRSPLLRRDKSSTASVQTVRGPSSLSPRQPRLSFPKVSATTVEAKRTVDVNDAEDSLALEGDINGSKLQGLQAQNGENRLEAASRAFRSLGRNRGAQIG